MPSVLYRVIGLLRKECKHEFAPEVYALVKSYRLDYFLAAQSNCIKCKKLVKVK